MFLSVVILIAFLITTKIINYVSAPIEANASYGNLSIEYIGSSGDIDEYRDTETGVHYFIYDNIHGYAGCGGITVRYNSDGTIYTD